MIWCLHGAVGMAADWNELAEKWSRSEHTVTQLDLWRFLSSGGVSLEEFGRALNEEVRENGDGEKNILVGYSMGGRLGLHALLAEPELWSAAVIVSAHPGLRTEEERLRRMAHDAEWAGKALTADWTKFVEEWSGQDVLKAVAKESEMELQGFADRSSLESQRQAVARSFMEWSLGKQEELCPRFSEIACPVLWVTGDRDEKFSDLAKEVVCELPHGEHVMIEGGGHRVPWEEMEAFADLVGEWVAKGEAGS